MKKTILSLALALAATAAHADIVYQWQGNNDATPRGIGLTLTFSDTAFDDGAVDVVMNANTGRPQTRPGSELINLHYTTPGFSGDINFNPSSGIGAYDRLMLHFTQDESGFLAGSLYATNTMTDFQIEGSAGLFQVMRAGSDHSMEWAGCTWNRECSGATGRFVRVTAMPEHAGEVPEPATLAILGAGLLGIAGARRKK